MQSPEGQFYLGTNAADEQPLFLEASNLTTHGVIVGMTGSGKTGLGIVLLEEALQSGISTLIIDPKGDMGNLMLSFPQLLPTDFIPWINESEAKGDVATAAYEKAEQWKAGLQRSGIEPSRIQALHEKADFTIYTPGSTAGIPLNVIGSLKAPAPGTDPETLQDEIDGFVSSLLKLIGIDSDPLSSREHILLSNIIHWHWSAGKDLDLGKLIALVQQPPMRKLGVIDLDTFFPPGDRVKLAMQINGLVASPSFSSWSEGQELDIQRLLYADSGKAQAAIICLSHLSEEERQFVVTLLLSKMVTWMRAQPGTSDLRALIYMDEVFGYVPPVGVPPSKKPILTILKQARAFGVGLVLSTQNPIDIDYKAISNAGTWMIGRLQTDRDKQRLLDGMGSSNGAVDIKQLSESISQLGKREFVLHSNRASQPRTFSTRWAMSYLAGPLTRDQINDLTRADLRSSNTTERSSGAAQAGKSEDIPDKLADNESVVAPVIADSVVVRFLDPSVPYAKTVGASPTGKRLQAGLAVRVHLLFDDTRSDLRHETEWEAIYTPLKGDINGEDGLIVDYDDRNLRKEAPEQPIFLLPDAKIQNKTYFKSAQKSIKNYLYRKQELALLHNPELDLYSRIGESRQDFAARCQAVADERTDEDVNKLRTVLAKQIDKINAAIAKSEDKLRELQFDAASRKQELRNTQIMDIAGGLLGGLLGGRRSTRSIIASTIKQSQSSARMISKAEERLETAENRYQELLENRDELESSLREDLFAIQLEWSKKVDNISTYTVGLERTDITIDDVTLIWIPRD